MATKTYQKLVPNPLGLGKGKVIKDEIFEDKGFSKENQAKLKLAIEAGRVKEINPEAVSKNNDTTVDQKTFEAKVAELEAVTKRAEEAEAKVAELEAKIAELEKAQEPAKTTKTAGK